MSKLKAMRNKAGLSQSQLANLTGINVGTLRHYEQGSKNFDHAKFDTILKTCIALNCGIEDIIESEEYLNLYRAYKQNKKRG